MNTWVACTGVMGAEMTDDIVTRLRDLAMKEQSPWANIYDNVMREAADEIERLRAEVEIERLRAEVARLSLLTSWLEAEFNAAVKALKKGRKKMDISTLKDYLEDVIQERDNLVADRDRWRSLAERAMDLLDEANKVLATIQEGLKRD